MSAMKEIHHLMKNLYSISNGQAELVKFDHPRNTIDIYLKLSPTDGLYKGGNFLFVIQLHLNFPHCAPESITCMTPICHPNIDTRCMPTYGSNNVCLNLLEDWHTDTGLTGLVAGLMYLLYYPQLDDPLNDSIGQPTMEEFKAQVRRFMNGEVVGAAGPHWDQQTIMDEFAKQMEEDWKSPDLDDEVKQQQEAMETDDDMDTSEKSESFRPLQNSEAMQLYSLIQHQNSIVKSNSVVVVGGAESNCASAGEITPFSAPEHFKEEFNGYKLTKYGTTVIKDDGEQQALSGSSVSPFHFLVKRYTT